MRIAYVINSVEGGGAASPVPAVVGVMRDHGADVRVFGLTLRDGRALPAMHAAGLTVDVRQGGERDHVAALRWLDRAVVDWQPSLIWTSLTRATLLGQIVGLRRAVPVVSWQHAAYLKPANRILLRAAQSQSALWIGDSHSISALTAERLHVPANRIATWPLFAADVAAPQAPPWQPGEPLRLGTLGRLHSVKGHDILVMALARMRAQGFVPPVPFTVDIAGEGSGRAETEAALAAARIDNVRLVGFTDQPRTFLAGLHLYLQPSRSEGLCIAAHEAMQAGLPTIVSAVGELPYSVVEGTTGLIVPPGDPDALAGAIRRLLLRPDRLAAMGTAARTRVLARFGATAFAAAGADVMRRLPVAFANDRDAGRHRSPGQVPIDRSA